MMATAASSSGAAAPVSVGGGGGVGGGDGAPAASSGPGGSSRAGEGGGSNKGPPSAARLLVSAWRSLMSKYAETWQPDITKTYATPTGVCTWATDRARVPEDVQAHFSGGELPAECQRPDSGPLTSSSRRLDDLLYVHKGSDGACSDECVQHLRGLTTARMKHSKAARKKICDDAKRAVAAASGAEGGAGGTGGEGGGFAGAAGGAEGSAPLGVGGVPPGMNEREGGGKKKGTSNEIKMLKLERDLNAWSQACHRTSSCADWELVTVAYDASGGKASYVIH